MFLNHFVHLKFLIFNVLLTIAYLTAHKSPAKNKMIKT
jgi:hypothetical protein